MTETNAQSLKRFLDEPEVKLWYSGVATELKDSTRQQYAVFLLRYFGNESPGAFLKRAQENQKPVAIEVKSRLGEIYKKSMHAAHCTKYALRSFLQFHEIDMHVNGKIKVRRVRKKPELKWDTAEKIIHETDEPYRSLFTFMLWSGLGEDEVMEIQRSPEVHRSMESQRDGEYVKINLTPRKSNLDEFYTLVPVEVVPKFPLNTHTYKDRGAALIDPHDMTTVWRRAAKKIKVWYLGLGPHQLRSAFRSQCGKADVDLGVAEFFMGHGASDRYGYGREVLDEEHASKEIKKLWEYNKGGSREAITELQAKVKELNHAIAQLQKDKGEPVTQVP
jgi:hypothetical protein